MKKTISFLVAVIMVFSLIGIYGCNGMGQEYSYSINWDVDLNNPIDLKGLYPETSLSTFGNDDTSSIIAEKTGYNVTYEEVSGGTADNEINNILTTQGQYHFLKLTEAQYHPYLADGTFLDLTELLENTESGRKLYDIIDNMDYGWDAVTYVDDDGTKHIYGIPDFGYCMMEDTALIWNVDHLKQIGYVDEDGNAVIPSTIDEFTDALYKCQALFGGNSSYHAFDIPGENSCLVSPLTGAFEVPWEFYVDGDGNIQQMVFSDNTSAYAEYMNTLYKQGIISSAWRSGSTDSSILSFSSGLCSVTYLPYWYVTALIKAVASNDVIPAALGIDSTDYRAVHDGCVLWTTRVRGDGTNGSVEQEKARHEGGEDGVSYYTVIPSYMAEYAVYVIDFLGKKLEAFDEFYGGIEGTHWNETETPEGAEDYYEAGDKSYLEYETYAGADSVIYLEPYSYTYRVGEMKADGTYDTVTKSGGGKWVKLTQRYLDQIVDNSQYCNGTNSVAARTLFHLRETGFDAWQVTVTFDETAITNPMSMAPPFKNWSVVSILSRTIAKRGIASAICASSSTTATKALNITRTSMRTSTTRKGGVAYYYWSDDIVNEMTEWYVNVKLNRS